MKSLLAKFIVIGLILFVHVEVRGADWKLYSFNDKGKNYYDAQSITRASKNIVRVWVKWNYTEKGVMDIVEKMGKEFKKLEYSIILNEINCAEKTTRFLSLNYFDNNREVIVSGSYTTEWTFIVPDTIDESLYKEICK